MTVKRDIKGGLDINYIQNLGFDIGTKVKISTKIKETNVEYTGLIVDNYDNFFNVKVQTKKYGSFIVSVNKVDLVLQSSATKVMEVA